MALYQPIYRLTLYLPRSEDADEDTVLTPVVTAAHSDAFKIASAPGVAGFKPYLGPIAGRFGRLDPISKRTDSGVLTLRIIDVRTDPPDNAERWVSAFLGTLGGKPRLTGCKGIIERSLNNGSSWATWFTGRTGDHMLSGRNWIEIQLQDLAADLDLDVFATDPHDSVTYAFRPSMQPIAIAPGQPWYGTPGLGGAVALIGTVKGSSGIRSIDITGPFFATTGVAGPRNVLTKDHMERGIQAGGVTFITSPEFGRVVITRLDTSATGHLRWHGPRTIVGAVGSGGQQGWDAYEDGRGQLHPKAVLASDLIGSDPHFIAVPPAGTVVRFYVIPRGRVTEKAPILIPSVHYGQFIKDLVEGKFSPLNLDGSVRFHIPYDGDLLDAIIADVTIPPGRFRLNGRQRLPDVLEQLCRQRQLAHFLNAFGEVTVLDARMPSSVPGVATITNDDIYPDEAPAWRLSRGDAITRIDATYYVDDFLDAEAIAASGAPPDIAAGGIVSSPSTLILLDEDRSLGERKATLDAWGDRTSPGETLNGEDRTLLVQRRLDHLLTDVRVPFSRGAQHIDLPCRLTSPITDLRPGDLRFIDVDELPNPATNERGGNRLGRCVEVTPIGLRVRARFLDLGLGTVPDEPALADYAVDASDANHGVEVDVTRNAAGQPVQLMYIATATSVGSRPGTDAAWESAGLRTANGLTTINPLPGKRIWLRGRTLPDASKLQLPSGWVFPSGSGFVDLPALAAPTTLVVTPQYGGFVATWVSGDATAWVDVYLATPAAGALAHFLTLDPGTTRLVWDRAQNDVEFRIEIGHRDRCGNESARIGDDFTTGGSAPTIPALAGVRVLHGNVVPTA